MLSISLFAGEAKLKDFYLGNPKGFNSPQAMSVKAIYVDVDEKSITGNPIIIDRIEVVAPEINYEKVRRTDNFKTILNNVKKSARTSKSSTSKEKSSKDGAGKKLVIKNFIVRDGNVNMAMSAQGGPSLSASASLPDIHLKNVGEKSGGATAEEVFNISIRSTLREDRFPCRDRYSQQRAKDTRFASPYRRRGRPKKQLKKQSMRRSKGCSVIVNRINGWSIVNRAEECRVVKARWQSGGPNRQGQQ